MCREHNLKIYKAKERLFAANGERMACEGRTPLKIEYQGITTPVMALVSSAMKNDMLISWEDLQKMQVLPRSFPQTLVRNTMSESQDAGSVRDKMISEFP